MKPYHFCHHSTGKVQFDPGQGSKYFEPWWALLMCDEGIIDYYAWLLRRSGQDIQVGSRWGAHVCIARGEKPTNLDLWGVDPGPIRYSYAAEVETTNGYHAWLTVESPELTDLRHRLGLPVKKKTYYHLTLGRLVVPQGKQAVQYDSGDMLIL